MVGQKALTATLKNAIATDRLAHAYLFCGTRGVGKTSCSRIFAKAINCKHLTPDGEPCNQCESCIAFNENRSLNIAELDAASNNSVEDIRQLVEQVQTPPINGRYRVFIIDEVHMLSSAAFNAFLKTLEEPPSYVVFILATTEKHKIIPTILSRCQIYDFSRITVTDMVDHLEYVAAQEGYTTERAALNVIARKADGAMRDALSIFDQVAASSRGNITYASTIENLNVLDSAYYSRLMEAFMTQDVSSALLIYKEIRDRGFDSHFFVNGLASFLRDLMVARAPETASLVDTDEERRQQMATLAARVPVEFFFKAMSLCNDADLNYRQASSKTFLVELLLIKLCQLLSPSPIFDGDGEGQLKPFAVPAQAAEPQQPATPAQSGQTPGTSHQQPAKQPVASTSTSAAAAYSTPATSTPAAPSTPASRQGAAPPRPAAGMPPRRSGGVAHTLQSTARRTESTSATATTESHTASAPKRDTPFTDSQLQYYWDQFANERPAETILVNAMRACRPSIIQGARIKVETMSEVQRDKLLEFTAEITTFLHNSLANDSIEINFAVSDSGPSPLLWNDREILAHLNEDPRVAKFITDLGLSLL